MAMWGWFPQTLPDTKKEKKKFIKCSHAGHDIILTNEFVMSIPTESKKKMDLPCGCKKVSADEIKQRVKTAEEWRG